MARARNIKPGFFTNEELVELPFSTRLLFIGLWTLADREGRLEDKPKRIKMHLFPADEIDVDVALCGLQASGFLTRYEVDGARYIQVLAFRKHQNPHRDEKPSSIPPVGGHSANTVQAPCPNSANPADSPIPDSPIPETPTTTSASAPAESGGGPEASPDIDAPKAAPLPARQDLPEPSENPALALTVALRPLGVSALSTHPTVMGWADKAVSLDILTEAVRIARESKGNETLSPNYLSPIVDRLLNPQPDRRVAPRGPAGQSQKFHFADVDRSADVAAMQAGLAARGVTQADLDDDSPL